MEDRFKFRCWKKSENRMIEGVLYLNPFLLDKNYSNEADDYILMQSTGLKDMAGDLIYEGDILRLTKTSWNGEEYSRNSLVVWDHTQWQAGLMKYHRPKAQPNRRYDRKIPLKHFVSMTDYTPYKEFVEAEIIGNAYENPELLEGV